MTDPAASASPVPASAASAPATTDGPTKKFMALAGIAAFTITTGLATVGTYLNEALKNKGSVIPARDTSTKNQGVVARMNEFVAAQEMPKTLQPYPIKNPVTGEAGTLEVVNFSNNCFNLLVGGAGLTTSSQLDAAGKPVPVAEPYKYCANPKLANVVGNSPK